MRMIRTAAAIAVLSVVGIGAVAVPAQAKGSDITRSGDCSGVTNWKLKVGPEDGRLEVEGQIDSNRSWQHWSWSISQDGRVKASGRAVTGGTSGSFSVRRLLANSAGTDTIVLRASRTATGETCRGVVVF